MTYFRIGYIYLITNLINGKQYVGQTVTTVDRRWNIHLKSAECGMSTVLARAIRKYGADNFKVEELLQCMEPTLNTAECRFIKDLYTLTPNGYNMTEGGSGVRLTKAQLKRKAARRVGVPLSEYHRSRISESLIGKVHSAEWCRNSSEAQLGRKASEAATIAHVKAWLGKHCSTSHKAKISKALKGRVFSDEWRLKLSASAKQRCMSSKRGADGKFRPCSSEVLR